MLAGVDLTSGFTTYSDSGSIHEQSRLALHPDLDRLYGADNGLVPDNIERHGVNNGVAGYAAPTPPAGAYQIGGDLRIKPDGTVFFTRLGNIFRATNDPKTDMTWAGKLPVSWRDLAFDPSGKRAYVLDQTDSTLAAYDGVSLQLIAKYPAVAPADRIFTGSQSIILVRDGANAEVETIPYGQL